MLYGRILLYTGIGIVIFSLLGGVTAWLIIHIRKKKLEEELEEEYGKRHS